MGHPLASFSISSPCPVVTRRPPPWQSQGSRSGGVHREGVGTLQVPPQARAAPACVFPAAGCRNLEPSRKRGNTRRREGARKCRRIGQADWGTGCSRCKLGLGPGNPARCMRSRKTKGPSCPCSPRARSPGCLKARPPVPQAQRNRHTQRPPRERTRLPPCGDSCLLQCKGVTASEGVRQQLTERSRSPHNRVYRATEQRFRRKVSRFRACRAPVPGCSEHSGTR